MRVLVFNPAGKESCIREECCVGGYPLAPPAQAALAAQYLHDRGFDATLIDNQTKGIPEAGFTRLLEGSDAVVAWVGLYGTLYSDVAILKAAKARGVSTLMVLNDPIETLEREAMERFPYIDVAVRLFEREMTIAEVLGRLKAGKGLAGIRGIVYRKEGKVIDTGTRPPEKDLHHLGSSVETLQTLDLKRYKEGLVVSGRGCPFLCAFCLFQGTVQRTRKPADVADEMALLSEHTRFSYVLDLNMFHVKPFIGELVKELSARKIDHFWKTDARVNEVDDATLRSMVKAGLAELILGVESVSPEVIKAIRKGITPQLALDAYRTTKRAGIIPYIELMFGFPWDSQRSARESMAFFSKLKAPTIVGTSVLRPLVGTLVYAACRKHRLIPELQLDDYVHALERPLITRTISLDRRALLRQVRLLGARTLTLNAQTRLSGRYQEIHGRADGRERLDESVRYLKGFAYQKMFGA